MTKLTFDRAAYATQLKAFRSNSVALDGSADRLGSTCIAALILGELSKLALAITFYDAFEPKNGKGKKCEPKEGDDGSVSVRNLEQPGCKGSGGARKMLEGVFYVYANRDVSAETAKAVEAYAMGDKFTHNGRATKALSMLVALIKAEKSRLAREQAGETEAPEAEDDDTVTEATMTDGERLAAALAMLKAVTTVSDASERLIIANLAAELDRIAAITSEETEVAEAA